MVLPHEFCACAPFPACVLVRQSLPRPPHPLTPPLRLPQAFVSTLCAVHRSLPLDRPALVQHGRPDALLAGLGAAARISCMRAISRLCNGRHVNLSHPPVPYCDTLTSRGISRGPRRRVLLPDRSRVSAFFAATKSLQEWGQPNR